MIAERKQIAEKFRSEGKGEAQKVLGQKERDLQEITSEAYRIAQEVKGKADAEAAKIYAEAYGIDPDFLCLHSDPGNLQRVSEQGRVPLAVDRLGVLEILQRHSFEIQVA